MVIARKKAYMDITIDERQIGRIVFELYNDLAPKNAENFLKLCTGELGRNKNGIKLWFQGNKFHRVVKNFIVGAGDIVYGFDDELDSSVVGKGGASIFSLNKEYDKEISLMGEFEKENLADLSTRMNLVMTSNNCSQFFINTYPCPHLTGKHSVFGKVIHGKSVIREIENLKTNDSDIPFAKVVITNCGEWEPSLGVPIYNACYDTIGGDIYEEFPDDEDKIDDSTKSAYEATMKIKDSGTILFKDKENLKAFQKFKKALRYCNEFIPDQDSSPEYYNNFLNLKAKLLLNLSLTALNLKQFQSAITYSTFLLELDDILAIISNQDIAKALYRRSRGYMGLGISNYPTALNDLKQAQHYLHPKQDPAINTTLQQVNQAIISQKQKEKSKYSSFFN